MTFWLLGEDSQAREYRTKERTERRGSRALVKANLQQGMKNINVNVGPKSSLKNRDNAVPRTSLTRSSSLESPKKLRFANDLQLENCRYHRFVWLCQFDGVNSTQLSSAKIRSNFNSSFTINNLIHNQRFNLQPIIH